MGNEMERNAPPNPKVGWLQSDGKRQVHRAFVYLQFASRGQSWYQTLLEPCLLIKKMTHTKFYVQMIFQVNSYRSDLTFVFNL